MLRIQSVSISVSKNFQRLSTAPTNDWDLQAERSIPRLRMGQSPHPAFYKLTPVFNTWNREKAR